MTEASTFFQVLRNGEATVQGYHYGHEKGSIRVRYKTAITFDSGSHSIWSRYTDFKRLSKKLKQPSNDRCPVCDRLSKLCDTIKLPSRNRLSFASPKEVAKKRLPSFDKFISEITKAFIAFSHEQLRACESHKGAVATLRSFWHLNDFVEKAMASNGELQGTISYMKESNAKRDTSLTFPEDITTKLRCEVTDHYVPHYDGWRSVKIEYFRLGDEDEDAGRLKIIRKGIEA